MASRREVLAGAVALAACGSAPPEPAAPDPREPRPTGAEPLNVVLVLTDDQRWDLGPPLLAAPGLSRLAAEGVRFTDAFVTTSLCCPSRASLLTGLYAHAHGVLDNKAELDPAFVTWNQLAQRAGVDTALIGKWHMGGANPHPRPGWTRWIGFRGQGRYDWPGTDPDPADRGFSFDGELREVSGYVTDLLTDLAVEYLEGRDGQRPFALVVSHKAVHAPFLPAERHRDALADVPVPTPLPDTDAAYAGVPDWLRRMRATEFGADRPYGRWPDFASWYRDYLRTFLSVDESVGRILDVLDRKGLRSRTAVIYTSDNGFQLGEQGVLDKRNFYESSIRVPLYAHVPGAGAPGGTVDRFALNVDVAPTVLELLGLQPPEAMHGRSLLPLLRGETEGWRQEFVYEYFFERAYPSTPTLFGLRTKKLKLATTHGMDVPDQLFDLETDPQERTSVAADPAYAERHAALAERLRNHLDRLGLLPAPVWGRNWVRPGAEAAGATPPPRPAQKAPGRSRKPR